MTSMNWLRSRGPWHIGRRSVAVAALAAATALATVGGAAAGASAAPAATTVTGPASYTVMWDGQTVSMALVRDTRIAGIPVAQVTNFQTNDPAFACYDGRNMPAYAHQPGWPPNDLVVRARDPRCARKSGQWVFSVLQQGLNLAGHPSHIGWWHACIRARGQTLCHWVNYGRSSRLQARLTQDGQPLADATVAFGAPPAGTRLSAGSCVTDAAGRCSVTFTVYQVPDTQTTYTLDASSGSLSAVASVTYGIRPVAGGMALSARAAPALIGWVRLCAHRVCRWGYQGNVSRITARVRRGAAPAAGVPVAFSTVPGIGVELSSATCTTGSNGTCSVRLRVVRPPLASKLYTAVAEAAGHVARTHVEYGVRPRLRAAAAGE